MHGGEKTPKSSFKEFPFLPRIINPVKIKQAVFFSADEQVRNAKRVLEGNMPWIDIKVFSNPVSVSNYRPNQASIFIFDDTAMNIVDTQKIRQNSKDAVLILLSSNEFIRCSPPSVAEERFPFVAKADLVFCL